MAEDLEVVEHIGINLAARSLLVAIENEVPTPWRRMLADEIADLGRLVQRACEAESPNGRACVLHANHLIRHCSRRLNDEMYRERWEG